MAPDSLSRNGVLIWYFILVFKNLRSLEYNLQEAKSASLISGQWRSPCLPPGSHRPGCAGYSGLGSDAPQCSIVICGWFLLRKVYVFFEFYLICIAVTDSSVLVLLQDNIFLLLLLHFCLKGKRTHFQWFQGARLLA